jgi:D-sedoheptulose 7-phosphate isomerase
MMIYDKLIKTADDQKFLLNEILVNHSQAIQDFSQEVVKTFHGEGRLLVMASGNLGTVATLVANLLAHRLAQDRPMLPAIDLCQNTTLATALIADNQGEQFFSRQLRAIARPGDIVLAFDDVRHDMAIREGLQTARDLQCRTAKLLIGSEHDGNDSDYLFCFPQVPIARGIEGAVFFGILLCELIETELFGF